MTQSAGWWDTRHPSAQQQVTDSRNRRLTNLARWPTDNQVNKVQLDRSRASFPLLHLRLRVSSACITWVLTGGDDGTRADTPAASIAVAAALAATFCSNFRGPAPVQRGEEIVLTVNNCDHMSRGKIRLALLEGQTNLSFMSWQIGPLLPRNTPFTTYMVIAQQYNKIVCFSGLMRYYIYIIHVFDWSSLNCCF